MTELHANTASELFNKSQLLEDFRQQRWFAQQDQHIDSFDILDWVQLPIEDIEQQGRLYWLLIRIADSHTYSVLVKRHHNQLSDAALHQGFIEQLRLAGDEGLTTENGAQLKLVGPINNEIITAIEPLNEASSNTLQRLETQTCTYVLKSYRLLDTSEENEVQVLTALSEQSTTPNLAGVIEYHFSSGIQYLGVITEFAHGEPIHKLYSQAIRGLIAELNVDSNLLSEPAVEAAKLGRLSRKIGRHTHLFHQQLNQAFGKQMAGVKSGFNFSAFVLRIRARWRSVYQAVKHDTSIADDCRKQVLFLLRTCARQILKSPDTAFENFIPITIAHNDLHLAHVFVDPEDDYYCRIIDPSPVALKASESGFSEQLALNDMVSLHRGMEYFSFDEIIDAIANVLHQDPTIIAQRLLTEPEHLQQACPQLFPLLGHWSNQIIADLTAGYQEQNQANESPLSWSEQARLYQAFYLNRLLQELDYNYAYGRQFFKLCDIYYLQQFTRQFN